MPLAVTIRKPTAYSSNTFQKFRNIFTALCLKKAWGVFAVTRVGTGI